MGPEFLASFGFGASDMDQFMETFHANHLDLHIPQLLANGPLTDSLTVDQWVQGFVPLLLPPPPNGPEPAPPLPPDPAGLFLDPAVLLGGADLTGLEDIMWSDQIAELLPAALQSSPQGLAALQQLQEESGVKLVHGLLTCADSMQRGLVQLATISLQQMAGMLPRVERSFGIGKVASHFIEALARKMNKTELHGPHLDWVGWENQVLYRQFYEAVPYLKFAHFAANQAILEAFDGHDAVHAIDLSLIHGLQWPALLQALALRPGGPPSVQLTGIGAPGSPTSLVEVGESLTKMARMLNVTFMFRAIPSSRFLEIKPWMLGRVPGEAIAVNSIFQLHKFIGLGLSLVLKWVRLLKPNVLTVVEQEANHNQYNFLNRFTEALYYYATMFDSMEPCKEAEVKASAQLYLKRGIINIVCCEGSARVTRHETLDRWRSRLDNAGFMPVAMSQAALNQAKLLLTIFAGGDGFGVEERDGVTHGR